MLKFPITTFLFAHQGYEQVSPISCAKNGRVTQRQILDHVLCLRLPCVFLTSNHNPNKSWCHIFSTAGCRCLRLRKAYDEWRTMSHVTCMPLCCIRLAKYDLVEQWETPGPCLQSSMGNVWICTASIKWNDLHPGLDCNVTFALWVFVKSTLLKRTLEDWLIPATSSLQCRQHGYLSWHGVSEV